jgi:hypothetical protein
MQTDSNSFDLLLLLKFEREEPETREQLANSHEWSTAPMHVKIIAPSTSPKSIFNNSQKNKCSKVEFCKFLNFLGGKNITFFNNSQ